MNRDYDLFEFGPGGPTMWRGHARGIEEARVKLESLACDSANEFVAIYVPASENTVRVRGASLGARRPFQIGYDEVLATTRAGILQHNGYQVTSVLGNDAARKVLSAHPRCDVFVIGHAAPEPVKLEMVDWLRANYPGTRIVALNPPRLKRLDALQFNAVYNLPDVWLPLVAQAAAQAAAAGG